MDKLYFQWHITDLCNFRCRHCYQEKFDPSGDLDIKGLQSVVKRIAEAAKERQVKAVINLTGGEPFLKKEFFELLALLDQQQEIERIILITNGSLISQKIIKRLQEFNKLNQIKISLDGADSSSNDAIRGEGNFEKTIAGINLLKQEARFSLILMFTLMKSNLNQAARLLDLCRALKLDGLVVERFLPMGQGVKINQQLINSRDWLNLVQTLLEITGQSYNQDQVISWRAFWVEFLKPDLLLWGADCNIGKDAFCIMPNADIFPCRRFNCKIGNLLDQPLNEITKSPLLNSIISGRRKGKCANCNILDCRGCAALSYLVSGDYLSEDTQCWKDH